jgi:hypothetical protein
MPCHCCYGGPWEPAHWHHWGPPPWARWWEIPRGRPSGVQRKESLEEYKKDLQSALAEVEEELGRA